MKTQILIEDGASSARNKSTAEQAAGLLNMMKDAARDYEQKQEKYYQEAHGFHQAGQKLLKIKRWLACVMQENELEQLSEDKKVSAKLVRNQSNVIVCDISAVPSEFTVAQRVINTAKIRKALVKGKIVAGTYLETESVGVSFESKKKSSCSH